MIALPVVMTVALLVRYIAHHELAVDFHHDFWVAGERIRHGLSPYTWSRRQLRELMAFPYPATGALLFVPFSLIPRAIADGLFVALSILGCLGALRVLRIADLRVYACVLAWWPVINGWQTANVTLLLAFGIALTWRYRDSPARAGVLTAVLICVKPVTWPLLLWLVATRRYRATATGLASTLVLSAVSWLTLGLAQVNPWLHLIRIQTDILYRQGYGLVALASHAGIDRGIATVLQLGVTAAATLACLALGRRRDGQRAAYVLAVALMLISSPLVDNHYFALLIVPIAIVVPRLERIWLAPLVLWLCPATGAAGWQVTLAWVTLVAVVTWLTVRAVPLSPRAQAMNTQVAASNA